MTGPAGADVVAIGAVADDSAFALQPARHRRSRSSEASADEESAAYRFAFLQYPRQLFGMTHYRDG